MNLPPTPAIIWFPVLGAAALVMLGGPLAGMLLAGLLCGAPPYHSRARRNAARLCVLAGVVLLAGLALPPLWTRLEQR